MRINLLILVIIFCCQFVLAQKGMGNLTIDKLPSKEKRWALIIGVDTYQKDISPLYGTVNDARALREVLINYAGFTDERIILMTTDSKDADLIPTKGNIIFQLNKLQRVVPQDGLILFSFSGHGVSISDDAFIVPSDGRIYQDAELMRESSIDVLRIKRAIQNTKVKQVIMFLDACRNDPLRAKGDVDNNLTANYAKGFSFETKNQNIEAYATLYATSFGDRAYEFLDKKTGKYRGYFSYAIEEGIKGSAANDKGEVTLAGLIKYIENTVRERVYVNESQKQIPYPTTEGFKNSDLVIAVVEKNKPQPEPNNPKNTQLGIVKLTKEDLELLIQGSFAPFFYINDGKFDIDDLEKLNSILTFASEARKNGFAEESDMKIITEQAKDLILAGAYLERIGKGKTLSGKPEVNEQEAALFIKNSANRQSFENFYAALMRKKEPLAPLPEKPTMERSWTELKIIAHRARNVDFDKEAGVALALTLENEKLLSEFFIGKLRREMVLRDSDVEEFTQRNPQYSNQRKRVRAEEILRRAQNGENFAMLAKQYSEGWDAKENGGLFIYDPGFTDKKIVDVVKVLRLGQVSDLFENDGYLQIIKFENQAETQVNRYANAANTRPANAATNMRLPANAATNAAGNSYSSPSGNQHRKIIFKIYKPAEINELIKNERVKLLYEQFKSSNYIDLPAPFEVILRSPN